MSAPGGKDTSKSKVRTKEPASTSVKSVQPEMVEEDIWIKSVCQMCFSACGILAHRINGVVVKIEGDPDSPQSLGRLCAKGHAGMQQIYDPQRLKVPLKRTNPEKGIGVDPQWQEITWEEALDTIVQKLRKIREDDPRKLSMITFDQDALVSGFRFSFGAAFGTPNLWLGASDYFCGNSVHAVGYATQGAFVVDPDLHYCNYLILIGVQTGFMAEPHAVPTAQRMADARARGMKVVVVDPVGSTAAVKADEWLPITPGTDGALAMGMLNVLLNELGIYDSEFIRKYTNGPYLVGSDEYYLRDKTTKKPLIWDPVDGVAKTYDSPEIQSLAIEGSYEVDGANCSPGFQLLKEHVKKYTPEMVSEITTIPAETIRRIAKEYSEAARIGSKIVVEGKEFPYRPACVAYKKGPNQHKHALLGMWAIHLLNMVVGNLDVPGGILGGNAVLLPGSICRWSWAPREDQDGMLLQGQRYQMLFYPDREAKLSDRVDLLDLFPVAPYSEPMIVLTLTDPERFKLPYKIEALLHVRTNVMMSTVNPEQVAAWLNAIPFIASFAYYIDETVEFADIVLPDACFLERLDVFMNHEMLYQEPGLGEWCYHVRQPVVEPPPGVRYWMEVHLDIADRVGFLKDLNHMINVFFPLDDPYKLDLDKKYSWEEIADRWAKSAFGPDHDLAWFKEHGLIKWPRKVEEVYPRIFTKARAPVYFEYMKSASKELKRVIEEMGLEWDLSDYQPFPDWKPCPAYEEKKPGYDLYPVPYKVPFHTFSHTANIMWLNELGEYHPSAYFVLINSQTAKKKGIEDGDLIWLENAAGKRVKGAAKVTEFVHPEVLGIAGTFGHWAKALPIAKGKGTHFNTLISADLEHIDMLSGAMDTCVKVRVYKAD